MTSSRLSVDSVIKKTFTIAAENFFVLSGAFFLYMITLWIPYLNVGTTIGIRKLTINISKGTKVSPSDIFKKENFDFMGQYFLLLIFMILGIYVSMLFLFVPAIVLSLQWMFAPLFLIDKNCTPYESLQMSTKATKGYKWSIFGSLLLLQIIFIAIALLIGFILFKGIGVAGIVVTAILAYFALFSLVISAYAYMYRELGK